ncbi:MAG: FAD-dependent oxidoreductase [Thermoleophilaceae bacterium]|nr:FAD-dependent oxidoreductase [Thermoleophilaceae bacterium]
MSDSRPEILIAGSGPGALEATLALSGSQHLDAHISLISPQLEFHYRPNMVMEPFGVSETAKFLVAEVIRHRNVTQWDGTLDRVDPAAGRAFSPEDDEFRFDALIVATGTESHVGLAVPAITFGTPGSLGQLTEIVHEIDHGNVRSVTFVAPTGHTWWLPLYEFALMSADRAERQGGQQISVSIVTPESAPLAIFGPENSATVAKLCAEFGVNLHLGMSVLSYDGTNAHLSDGSEVATDRLFAMPRLTGRAPAGVPTDPEGFVPVDDLQRVVGTTNVFGVGDVTNFRVKQGGLASAQADLAVAAIEHQFGTGPAPTPSTHEIEALLLTADRRLAMRARIGPESSTSIEIEQPTGPVQKIHSRLLADRLRAISPL